MATETPSPSAENATDPLVGTVVAERYRIIAALGQGGMGVTYRAWDLETSRPVVLKHPKHEILRTPGFVERFARESRMMAAFSHPNVVPVATVGDHEGIPYIVMPFLPGGSLSNRRSRDETGRPKPMPAWTLRLWLTQVADALDYIHSQGVVHRDVKPGNLFFDAFWHAYLGDFGIAKIVADNAVLDKEHTLTATSMAIGTQEYMAPEMFAPKAVVDGRVDQYALAVMVYEMLAGRRPFTGDTAHVIVEVTTRQVPPLRTVRSDLPPSLEKALYRALAKRPDERFRNCRDFADAVLADVAQAEAEPDIARLLCPECANLLKLPTSAAGREGKCPRCRQPMTVATDLSAMWLLSEESGRTASHDVFAGPLSVTSTQEPAAIPQWDVRTPTTANKPRQHRGVPGGWQNLPPLVRHASLAAAAIAVLFAEAVFVYDFSTSTLRREALKAQEELTKSEERLGELEVLNRELDATNSLLVDDVKRLKASISLQSDQATTGPSTPGKPLASPAPLPSGWQQVVAYWKGHAYAIVTTETAISKTASQYRCKEMGGHLVNIENEEELAFLRSLLLDSRAGKRNFHTSGFRLTGSADEKWIWSSGAPAHNLVSAPDAKCTIDDRNQEGSELYVHAEGLAAGRARWAEGFVCEFDNLENAPPVTVLTDVDSPPAVSTSSQLPKQERLGGGGGSKYEDFHPGGRLVGLATTEGNYSGHTVLASVQGIYLQQGKLVESAIVGGKGGNPKLLQAKPGYAVGAIIGKSGHMVDGLRLVFMRDKGESLDPSDSYESEWVGGLGGGDEVLLTGGGKPVRGMRGAAGTLLDSLSLMFGDTVMASPLKPVRPPLARFLFSQGLANTGTGIANWDLRDAPVDREGLFLNGVYEYSQPRGYRAVCLIPEMNYDGFTVAMRVKPKLASNTNVILVGGKGYRWFEMVCDRDGRLRLTTDNRRQSYPVEGMQLRAGEWATLACSFNKAGRTVIVRMDGNEAPRIELSESFAFEIEKADQGTQAHEKSWTFANYANGTAFHGHVDSWVFYDTALSAAEMAQLVREWRPSMASEIAKPPVAIPEVTDAGELRGTVLLNNRPFLTKDEPVLSSISWLEGGEQNGIKGAQFSYDAETGKYALSGLPPKDSFLLWLYFRRHPNDRLHLGGQYLFSAYHIDLKGKTAEQRSDFPLFIEQVIHLRKPIDNNAVLSGNKEDLHPVLFSPVTFEWAPVEGADSYEIEVSTWWHKGHPPGPKPASLKKTTRETTATFALEPTKDKEWYRVAIKAFSQGKQVADLMKVFANGYGWWVDFVIEPQN